MQSIRVGSIELSYRAEGTGRPVLLGHSSTGSGGQWRKLMADLSSNYWLIAPDHIGYGRTGQYDGSAPLMMLELELLENLLCEIAEPVHLVGHSYGGSLLSRIAVRNPERIRSVTLIEPSLFFLLSDASRHSEYEEIRAVADQVIFHVASGNPTEAARGFIDYWVGLGAFESMSGQLQSSTVGAMSKLAVEWPNAFEPWGATADALRAVKVPIQLLAGSETTSAARAVVDVLKSIFPDATSADIPNASHMGPVTHSDVYNSHIANFLSRLDDH